MRTDAYWAKRMETLNEALLGRGESYVRTMNAEYGRAMASIQKDVDVFYQRFATNNSVDLATARQMLKAGELREFKWSVEDYIKAGKQNAIDQRWMKELENASIRVRVSRLEALQMQMRQHVETLSARRQTGTAAAMGGIYKDGYYKTVFELQQGAGIGHSFAKLDNRQIDKLLVTPWAPDGSNFSARIWRDRTKLVAELQTTLTQGLIRGDSSDTMIDQIQARMGVSRSAAESLVLTESAYFAGQSRIDGYKALGVESYKYTATLDMRTSDICRGMDGKVFLVAESQPGVNYPPLHVRCRSTTIPHYEDNVQQRAARDEFGSTYDVPGDMTYKEWAKDNIPAERPATTDPVKPVDPVLPKQIDPEERMQAFEDSFGEVEESASLGVNRRYNPRSTYFAELPGATEEALSELADINRELAKTGYKQAKETLVLLDKAGGQERMRLSGSINKVAFSDEMHNMLAQGDFRSLILTHNHPRGTRVNVKDAMNLALYPSLGDIVAVGHDGGVSFVSALQTSVDIVALNSVLRKVFEKADGQLRKDKKYATMSKTAQQEYFDFVVLLLLVEEMGWVYGEEFSAAKADPRI